MSDRKPRFTGRHMTAILVGGFGIVIAVNFTMAALANSTFGGIVVENSYVASQKFNGWLDKAEKSEELGYSIKADHTGDGKVLLTTGGVPAGARITAIARHPLGHQPDTDLSFVATGPDTWISTETLPDTRWTLRLAIESGGDEWRGERPLP